MTISKRTLFLHIGMHKTGSTSIQGTLDGYRGDQVHYANFGHCNHGIAATTVFSRARYDYHYHRNRGFGAAEIDRLAIKWREDLTHSIEGCPGNLILSGEDLCHLGHEDLSSVRDFFVGHFDEIRVIAYVRDPVGYCSSFFQQVVRGGLTDFTVPLPSYRYRFEKYLDVFGSSSVDFIKFSRVGLYNGCVVEDFARRVGVDLDVGMKVITNEALPRQAVALAYRHNRSGLIRPGNAKIVKARARALGCLSEMFEGKFVLSDALVRESLDASDISWMEQAAGFSIFAESSSGNAGEVGSEADLLAIAEQAESELRAWVRARGYQKQSDDLMHAMVMGLLSESQ
jgi:hypothetical protein